MPASPSYKPLPHCCGKDNVDCLYLETDGPEDKPCWGEVTMYTIDGGEEGDIPVHLCEGHIDAIDTGTYRREVTLLGVNHPIQSTMELCYNAFKR